MHPILFEIPGIHLPIYSYGVMLGLSLVVGWYLVGFLARRDGLPADKITACYVWTAVAALLGARLLYIITNWEQMTADGPLDLLNVRKGGLVAYGGFLGGFLGSWLYTRRHGIRLLAWADAAVPALGTGLGITRIGCLLYGCDYGKPIPAQAPSWVQSLGLRFPNWETAFPEWAQRFADQAGVAMGGSFRGSPAFLHHAHDGIIGHGALHSALVYPTQPMEIANGWIAFGLTMLVRSKRHFRGQAFLFFTMYYGITRALMEIIRGDTQRGGIGFVSTSQIIGVGTFLAAIVAWIFLSKRAKRAPEQAMAVEHIEPLPPLRKRSKKTR